MFLVLMTISYQLKDLAILPQQVCYCLPWKQVKGMRDHIAHGYFDIDSDLIYEVVKEELDDLQTAIRWLKDVVMQ